MKLQKIIDNNQLNTLPEEFKGNHIHIRKVEFFFIPPCVYFLYDNENLVYIGSTLRLHSRMDAHLKSKVFNHIFYIPIKKSKLRQVEASLIKFYKPPYNSEAWLNAKNPSIKPISIEQLTELEIEVNFPSQFIERTDLGFDGYVKKFKQDEKNKKDQIKRMVKRVIEQEKANKEEKELKKLQELNENLFNEYMFKISKGIDFDPHGLIPEKILDDETKVQWVKRITGINKDTFTVWQFDKNNVLRQIIKPVPK